MLGLVWMYVCHLHSAMACVMFTFFYDAGVNSMG